MKHVILFLCLLITSACQSIKKNSGEHHQASSDAPINIVQFEFLENTFVVINASTSDKSSHRFLLDTGSGFDVISNSLCKKLNCKTSGKLTGKRMRGDEATIDLTTLDAIEFAGVKNKSWQVGVTKLFDEIPPSLGKLEGALSLKFFSEQPFTIDFPKKSIIIESSKSLEKRIKQGEIAEARRYSQLPQTLGFFLDMDAFGIEGSFEVDTGNLVTILPKTHLKHLSGALKSPNSNVKKGAQASRVCTLVFGKIVVKGQPMVGQQNPQVCFEDIIYDGVIGVDFFKDKVVTFDMSNSRIIFAKAVQ